MEGDCDERERERRREGEKEREKGLFLCLSLTLLLHVRFSLGFFFLSFGKNKKGEYRISASRKYTKYLLLFLDMCAHARRVCVCVRVRASHRNKTVSLITFGF